MKLKLRINTDGEGKLQPVDFAFIIYFAATALVALFSNILSVARISFLAIPMVLLLVGIGIALSFITVPSNRWKDSIALYLGIVLIFLFSYLLTPELYEWYVNPNWGLAFRVFRIDRGIYAYLFIRLVSNPKRIIRNLKYSGYIWALYLLWTTYQRVTRGYFLSTENDGITQVHSLDSLGYGYNCTFVALIFFTNYKQSKRKIEFIIGLAFSGLSIIYGSRGAIIVIGSYIVMSELLKLKVEHSKKKIFEIVAVLIIIVLCCVGYDYIIAGISSVLSRFGIESSNISSLLANQIGEANGRDRLWNAVILQIKEQFPFGAGAFGDRLTAGRIFAWGYCHNIILEMLASFGVLGLLILLVMIIKSVKLLIDEQNTNFVNLFLVFFCSSLKLVVSDSFWYSMPFWGAIGVAVCYRISIRMKNHALESEIESNHN